LLDSAEVSTFT